MSKILRIAVPIPLRRIFDYLPPENCNGNDLCPGIRVTVPFRGQKKIGYLIEVADHSKMPSSQLKPAGKIIDEEPLISAKDLKFLLWTSRYYHHPLGEVISSAFPIPLRKGKPAVFSGQQYLFTTEKGRVTQFNELRRARRQTELMRMLLDFPRGLDARDLAGLGWNWRNSAKQLVEKGLIEIKQVPTLLNCDQSATPAQYSLNPAQKMAIEQVCHAMGRFKTFLLEGVTGSGKTEVYLGLIEFALRQGKQVMMLLPEISLTPQLEARFRERLAEPIAVFHSGLTESERLQAWLCFRQGLAPILLGTRSAVFTPMRNPGLIILDEEHDASFKQQERFRFSARDISIARAKQLGIPVLLGSATPSFESIFNAKKGRFEQLCLPERAGVALPPVLKLLDIRNQPLEEGLSPPLVAEITRTLASGEQVLLFLNRRGFAPILICHGCGWIASCTRCDSRLVIHVSHGKLRCHHCGYEQIILKQCQSCGARDLRPLGLGTERVEQGLGELFPNTKIARIDRDSTQRKGSLESALQKVTSGSIDILLGTQMLAKGHHFPKVTLVGILDVDAGLYNTDFRASERLAQLIVQVAGRAGREQKPGKVILQTHHPDHPLLIALIQKGYRGFVENALAERKAALLPPFSFQALMRAEATKMESPMRFLQEVRNLVAELRIVDARVFGPVSAPLTKKAGLFRFQLLFQSAERKNLHRLLDLILEKVSTLPVSKRIRWSLDVDPLDFY